MLMTVLLLILTVYAVFTIVISLLSRRRFTDVWNNLLAEAPDEAQIERALGTCLELVDVADEALHAGPSWANRQRLARAAEALGPCALDLARQMERWRVRVSVATVVGGGPPLPRPPKRPRLRLRGLRALWFFADTIQMPWDYPIWPHGRLLALRWCVLRVARRMRVISCTPPARVPREWTLMRQDWQTLTDDYRDVCRRLRPAVGDFSPFPLARS